MGCCEAADVDYVVLGWALEVVVVGVGVVLVLLTCEFSVVYPSGLTRCIS